MTLQRRGATGDMEPRVSGHPARTILARLAREHEAATALYGAEIGHCSRCNRTLTDESSRARGIGPECMKKG